MKTVFMIAILSTSVAQAPSLKATTDWLRDFVQTEGRVSDGDWRDRYQVVANVCTITILHDTDDISCTKPENEGNCRNSPKVVTQHFKQIFNLKDIDLARVAVESNPSFHAYSVTMTTMNELPRVTHSVKVGVAFKKESVDSDHSAYVVLPTSQAATRVAEAFRHAAALCGGKASPF